MQNLKEHICKHRRDTEAGTKEHLCLFSLFSPVIRNVQFVHVTLSLCRACGGCHTRQTAYVGYKHNTNMIVCIESSILGLPSSRWAK